MALDLSRSFGQAASSYEAGRPDYPPHAVAWLLERVADRRPLRVADVGAGTGKLARVVGQLGAQVVAVDPDPAMLVALNMAVPSVPTFLGTAESLPLPDDSVDAVVLGQAWHWVDPAAASLEVGRVLRAGGALGLIWNFRDENVGWVADLGEIVGPNAAETMDAVGGPRVDEPFTGLEARTWRWTRTVDRAGVRAMVHSRSGFITATTEEKVRIDRELSRLLDSVRAVGEATVELPYVTRAYRAVRP
ncbi:class I SAM-dependent methyltransferase [Tessaracoccus lacteus]|uniref:Class I SAM-dependent methyltransferase n=1 Tax=Tessaracoccus lacteus TaxID=3041766 RepID=A0ABY8Q0U3_9ACTN|nr:class I SAM-dependent methyltransferase [Tessaracoccus sp. T21]WGT48441.1 class I SAM-dependent methyltransferase [Tessaracoccus sp. T21]